MIRPQVSNTKIITTKRTSAVFAFAAVLAALIFSVAADANNIRWYLSPSDPYLQNWSDTASIAVDDDWSNFIAITGYRGDDLTTGVGVNPQTVLADGEGTPVSVIANQSNPNTLNVGGIAEFDGIANPTIALRGSSVADAPHLLIRLNKESCPDSKFVSVSYKVRDLDGTSNNAVQQVALQYRVGNVGNYTNVGGAFVFDATEPNTATKVTSVVGMLPHIPVGLDNINLRIMTTNAAGNNEWVGIDDINIGCFAATFASADVVGRVLTPEGQPVSRASVTLVDTAGTITTVKTNTFGYYKFTGLPTGNTYAASVQAKGYTFASQLVTLTESLSDLDFFAGTPAPQPLRRR